MLVTGSKTAVTVHLHSAVARDALLKLKWRCAGAARQSCEHHPADDMDALVSRAIHIIS